MRCRRNCAKKHRWQLNKNALIGEEIDIVNFEAGGKDHPYLENIQELPDEEKKDMLIAGVDTQRRREPVVYSRR